MERGEIPPVRGASGGWGGERHLGARLLCGGRWHCGCGVLVVGARGFGEGGRGGLG